MAIRLNNSWRDDIRRVGLWLSLRRAIASVGQLHDVIINGAGIEIIAVCWGRTRATDSASTWRTHHQRLDKLLSQLFSGFAWLIGNRAKEAGSRPGSFKLLRGGLLATHVVVRYFKPVIVGVILLVILIALVPARIVIVISPNDVPVRGVPGVAARWGLRMREGMATRRIGLLIAQRALHEATPLQR